MRKSKEYWRAVLNVPEQHLQEQLSRQTVGSTSMPATDALAHMLAPYSHTDTAPAASTVLPSNDDKQGDEILALLPGNSTALAPHH